MRKCQRYLETDLPRRERHTGREIEVPTESIRRYREHSERKKRNEVVSLALLFEYGAIVIQTEVKPCQFVSCSLEVPVQRMRDFVLAQFDVHQEACPKASFPHAIITMCGCLTSRPVRSFLRPDDQLKMRRRGALSSNATARK